MRRRTDGGSGREREREDDARGRRHFGPIGSSRHSSATKAEGLFAVGDGSPYEADVQPRKNRSRSLFQQLFAKRLEVGWDDISSQMQRAPGRSPLLLSPFNHEKVVRRHITQAATATVPLPVPAARRRRQLTLKLLQKLPFPPPTPPFVGIHAPSPSLSSLGLGSLLLLRCPSSPVPSLSSGSRRVAESNRQRTRTNTM